MKTRTCDPLPARMLDFSRRYGLLPQGGRILCALSGGRDSMALLEALLAVSAELELTVLAAHYDHRLRGAESDRDRSFCAAWCRDRGVPLLLGSGDVAARAAETGRGLEETARAMRYAFLEEAARETGAGAVATAHNAEDNAETVLLHLTRGTGLDGLTGIPPRRGIFVRPLLEVSRREIDAFLAARDVPHVEDSTNASPDYARNRLRQEVLPVLRQLNPGFAATLADNLVHLREDRAFLRELAREAVRDAALTPEGLRLPAAALADAPDPVAHRGVMLLLARLGRYQFSRAHLEAVVRLARDGGPSGTLSLPRGLTARRDYGDLILSLSPDPPAALEARSLPGSGRYPAGAWTLRLTEGPSDGLQGPFRCALRRDAVSFPLTLRARRTGDVLRLPGRREKPLKKWYIDERIPRDRRDALPVLADGTGVLFAAGLGPQAALTARQGETALLVRLTPSEKETGKEREQI